MTKGEVCEYLGKSKRTVAQYMADGKLPTQYVSGPNGREARFDRADVERVKAEIDAPVVRPVNGTAQVALQTPGTALAKRGTMSEWEDFARLLATIVKARETPLALERYMSVAEAVEYSGLPAAYLIKAAKAGTIRAVNVGTGKREFWRFAREGAGK